MSEELLLALDQGTSATKAVLFTPRGRKVCRFSVPVTSLFPRPGFVEQDPNELYGSALAAVRGVVEQLEELGGDRSRIRACGISNQRETLVLWDKDGEVLCNAVVWQCKRSVDVCNRIRGTALERRINARTGLIADPYFSGSKVVWLYENDRGVRTAIDSGAAFFGTVDTWLLYRLTGGGSYLTDYTNACRTLFFNIDTLAWDRDLLEQFNLSGMNLAEPHPCAHPFGSSTFEGVFATPLPLCALIGDSHASAFGQGCFMPGTAKVTLGTGSSVLMNTGPVRRRSLSGMVETICFAVEGRTDYALEGIIVSCGSTLTWMRDGIGLFDNVDELEPAARSVESSEGVYLVPAFAGMGAPHWKMDARGMVAGMTFGTTRAHLLRAALESVAYQVKDVAAAMERDAGIGLGGLVADGGISTNTFVMQMLADLLGCSVTMRGIGEVSALGAACMAGLGRGLIGSLDECAGLESQPDCYLASDGAQAAQRGWEGWCRTLERL